jgi:hypothetical protein
MQLLMCNVAVRDTTVSVTATTGMLLDEPFASDSAAVWHTWTLPPASSDPLLHSVRPLHLLPIVQLG